MESTIELVSDGSALLVALFIATPIVIIMIVCAIIEGRKSLSRSRLYVLLEYFETQCETKEIARSCEIKVTLMTLDASMETKKAFKLYNDKEIKSPKENLNALWSISSRRCVIHVPNPETGVYINSGRLLRPSSTTGRIAIIVAQLASSMVTAKFIGDKIDLNGIINKSGFPFLAYSGSFKSFYETVMSNDTAGRAAINEFFEDHLIYADR